MTSDETTASMDFLATRFARMDAAFAAIDARVTAIEAHLTQGESQDEVRRDLSGVAAGFAALKEDLGREFGDQHVRLERYEIALAAAPAR
jgi:hypothetical protein